MTIENHVTSLEISKRLKELGVPQERFYSWGSVCRTEHEVQKYEEDGWKTKREKDILIDDPYEINSEERWEKLNHYAGGYCSRSEFYSAFLASEIAEMLPACLDAHTNLLEDQKTREIFFKKAQTDTNENYILNLYIKKTLKNNYTPHYSEKYSSFMPNIERNNLADALAKLLIHLLEKNILKPEDLK